MKSEIVISRDGSPTIRDSRTGATFHSIHGAESESRHIFIDHGLLYAESQFGGRLSVLEAGFGSGLNAALTLLEAERRKMEVRYTAVEKFPLEKEVTEVYGGMLDAPLAAVYRRVAMAPWQSATDLGYITLEKHVADFCVFTPARKFHVVYFDAFAPAVVPEMWNEKVFVNLAGALVPGGALVTFCAQGEVRRRLRRAGFEVQKLPGAPGKREMTRAIRG